MYNSAQSIRSIGKSHAHTLRLRRLSFLIAVALLAALSLIGFPETGNRVAAQSGPTMLVPNLEVRPVTTDLVTPISLAFIGGMSIDPSGAAPEMLVLEKNTGKVLHVVNGAVQNTALDLAVNNFSERGLLGIALHPNFPTNPGVYLFWSCIAAPPPADNPFFPVETECPDTPQLGADSDEVLAVPLLGNRVDRFIWNGSTLTFDRNLIKLLVLSK